MSRRVNIIVAACGLAGLLGAGGLACFAQTVISANAGLICYTEGRVLLNGRTLRLVPGRFPQMRTDDVLRSATGRGEILLNPGAFLRVRDNSAVRLLSSSLTEPRVEILSGAVIFEVADLKKETSVTAVWRGVTVSAAKKGVFRLDTNPAALRVFEGEALVSSEGRSIKVGKGKTLAFGGAWTSAKFDVRQVDSFDHWNGRRAVLVARSNARGGRSGRGLMRRGSHSGLYAANSPAPGPGTGSAPGSIPGMHELGPPALAASAASPSAGSNPSGTEGTQ
jgi:hypothetical protein